MDKIILRKLVMPDLSKLKSNSYIIYGTGEMADLYYEAITEKFGRQAIFCFVDGRNQIETYKNGKKILHYTELNAIQVNQYKYILATISASASSMKTRLLEAGVAEENILPAVTYFNTEELRKAMKTTEEIYFYPEFNNNAEWLEFYKRISEFVEFKQLRARFHIFLKNMNLKENRENIIAHEGSFECENNYENLILVREAESICNLTEKNALKRFCIDESFMFNLEKKMLVAMNDEGTIENNGSHYKSISQQNFKKMKKESQKYKAATVFGAGPSLEAGITANLDFLRHSFNIVCNDFFKLDNIMELLKPKIYALSDSIYFAETYHSYREQIVKYINEHDCWLCMNLDYVSYLVRQYGLDENKAIGFEFVKDEVIIPDENNLKLYIGGSVVLTCSFPIGFSIKNCVYAMGCDGSKTTDDKMWEYQKGICAELDKIDTENRIFGTFNISSSVFLPKVRAGYKKVLTHAMKQGKEYYTLTHSYFELLEKNYIELS